MVEDARPPGELENDDRSELEEQRKEVRRLLIEKIRSQRNQGIITNFYISKPSVGGNEMELSGGGKKDDRMLEERKRRLLTGKSWSNAKTRGGKFKKVKSGTKKKLGAKSFAGREPGKAKTDSSQSTIMKFFNGKKSPEEIEVPRELLSPYKYQPRR